MKLNDIKAASEYLIGKIVDTPLLNLSGSKIKSIFSHDNNVKMKLEFLQHVGSFKARGVLLGLAKLSMDQKTSGVIAVSCLLYTSDAADE